jgi:tetratricopeptide (TPR) repeat protein
MKDILLLFLLISCASLPQYEDRVASGNEFLNQGLYREAIESYRDAIKINEKAPSVHKHLGVVLFKVGAYEESIMHLMKCFPDFQNNFEVNFVLGESYRALKLYDKAIIFLQKSLFLEKESMAALRSLSWTYLKLKDYKKAKKYAEKALHLNRSDEESLIILLHIYSSLQQYKQMIKIIETYHEEFINPAIVLALKGDAYLGLKEIDEAIDFYKKALKIDPLLSRAFLGLSECYEIKEDYVNAKKMKKIGEGLYSNEAGFKIIKKENRPLKDSLMPAQLPKQTESDQRS